MRDELKRHVIKASWRREVGWHPRVARSALACGRSFIPHPAAVRWELRPRPPIASVPIAFFAVLLRRS